MLQRCVKAVALAAALVVLASAPSVLADCQRPDDGDFCTTRGYTAYNIDCDDDGDRDWACSTRGPDQYNDNAVPRFGTLLSTDGCQSNADLRDGFTDTWDTEMGSCEPAFDATTECAPVEGYKATADSAPTTSLRSAYIHISQVQTTPVLGSVPELVESVAEACQSMKNCSSFTSDGWMLTTPLYGSTPYIGVCKYEKLSPVPSKTDCARPNSGSFCKAIGTTPFFTDCDGDGKKDWACSYAGLSDNGVQVRSYAVARSFLGCDSPKTDDLLDYYARQPGGWVDKASDCTAALATTTSSGKCLVTSVTGFGGGIYKQGFALTGSDTEFVHIMDKYWDPVTFTYKLASFTNAQDLIAKTADACRKDASCMAFTTDGYMAITSKYNLISNADNTCMYVKTGAPPRTPAAPKPAPAPAAPKPCSRPGWEGWGRFCSAKGFTAYNLDCDYDGALDWACVSVARDQGEDESKGKATSVDSTLDCTVVNAADAVARTKWPMLSQYASMCPPALFLGAAEDLPCPTADGYATAAGKTATTSAGKSGWLHITSVEASPVFTSADDLVARTAAACSARSDCQAFLSDGWMVVAGTVSSKTYAGMCLYTKAAPAPATRTPGAAGDCERSSPVSQGGNQLCTTRNFTALYTDCDGDGYKDWACYTLNRLVGNDDTKARTNTVSSKLGCANANGLDDKAGSTWPLLSKYNGCPAAFAVGTADKPCPSNGIEGSLSTVYNIMAGKTASTTAKGEAGWKHISMQIPYFSIPVFDSVQALVQRTANVCALNPNCRGFLSDGWMLIGGTVSTKSYPGICYYAKK